MKNNLMLNNKGFVLAETLIVAVAICLIFTIVYRNFYPLMAEYERRENYDDIDSKYGTYWFKKMFQSCDYVAPDLDYQIEEFGAVAFDCDDIYNETNGKICYKLLEQLEVSCDDPLTDDKIETCKTAHPAPHIFITKFNLVTTSPYTGETVDYKKKFINSAEEVRLNALADYLRYLPDYSKITSLNKAKYRIIVEYYRHRFDTPEKSAGVLEVDSQNDFKSFATIEVKRECDDAAR